MPAVCGKNITASEKEMLSQLPVTYHGKNLKVEYMVKVIQKNDALNDLTESGSAFYIALNVNQHDPNAVKPFVFDEGEKQGSGDKYVQVAEPIPYWMPDATVPTGYPGMQQM